MSSGVQGIQSLLPIGNILTTFLAEIFNVSCPFLHSCNPLEFLTFLLSTSKFHYTNEYPSSKLVWLMSLEPVLSPKGRETRACGGRICLLVLFLCEVVNQLTSRGPSRPRARGRPPPGRRLAPGCPPAAWPGGPLGPRGPPTGWPGRPHGARARTPAPPGAGGREHRWDVWTVVLLMMIPG